MALKTYMSGDIKPLGIIAVIKDETHKVNIDFLLGSNCDTAWLDATPSQPLVTSGVSWRMRSKYQYNLCWWICTITSGCQNMTILPHQYIENKVGTKHGQDDAFGKLLWLSMKVVVILTEVMWQSSPENETFIKLLSQLREGKCTDEDYTLLNSHVIRNVNPGLGPKCDPLACGVMDIHKWFHEFIKFIRFTRLDYLQS